MDFDDAISLISGRVMEKDQPCLAVVSANLDHITNFGDGSPWASTIVMSADHTGIQWLNLLDGAPLASQARRMTGRRWPRLAGSDLIGPLLDAAGRNKVRVGFLGGTPTTHAILRQSLSIKHPDLTVAGWWAPERSTLLDKDKAYALAAEIAHTRVEMLIVCLGKPLQEMWIADNGENTGASVMLAFGAVVDFLAGRVKRAPEWVIALGLEWLWRLSIEPRRLYRRYVFEGPVAYGTLRRKSHFLENLTQMPERVSDSTDPTAIPENLEPSSAELFAAPHTRADITVIVVTHNSANYLETLVRSLRHETADFILRVVVADNDSTDDTRRILATHADIITVPTGGNLGYAGGINKAMKHAGETAAVLIVNPDLEVERGALNHLWNRMRTSGAGIVVPTLLDSDGTIYTSLRREPTILTALGDAVCGSRARTRPSWSSEIDYAPVSYRRPHTIDWATGASLLIRFDLAEALGEWDERYFLYSEETEYFRRARRAGAPIWFEPKARMRHARGGSGHSRQLDALMAVNRIRYARRHNGRLYSGVFRAVVSLHEGLRAYSPRHRGTLVTVLNERRWARLPQARDWDQDPAPREYADPASTDGAETVPADDRSFPPGSVIIPAHNEAAVIDRTLGPLAPLAASGRVEVIVACNGCTDDTAAIARTYPGVRVLELQAPSKHGALNAADTVASVWPRLYLDADIRIGPATLRTLLERLSHGDILAARPMSGYDDTHASWPVLAFYRARRRMASLDESLWGAGAYALTETGHARMGQFPPLTADDLVVDRQFAPHEKAIIPTAPVRVATPKDSRSLMAILRRNYRGQRQVRRDVSQSPGSGPTSTTGQSLRDLASSVRGPSSGADATVYAVFVTLARLGRDGAVGSATRWERDESSRTPPAREETHP